MANKLNVLYSKAKLVTKRNIPVILAAGSIAMLAGAGVLSWVALVIIDEGV